MAGASPKKREVLINIGHGKDEAHKWKKETREKNGEKRERQSPKETQKKLYPKIQNEDSF